MIVSQLRENQGKITTKKVIKNIDNSLREWKTVLLRLKSLYIINTIENINIMIPVISKC